MPFEEGTPPCVTKIELCFCAVFWNFFRMQFLKYCFTILFYHPCFYNHTTLEHISSPWSEDNLHFRSQTHWFHFHTLMDPVTAHQLRWFFDVFSFFSYRFSLFLKCRHGKRGFSPQHSDMFICTFFQEDRYSDLKPQWLPLVSNFAACFPLI